ncbi:SPOR domain-containing protein [Sediminitomix flava]|nr:SPOR domain-containing protein [Sediminitomix flava]
MFNEEKPYTLLLGRYRYVEEIKSLQRSLEQEDINTFVYTEHNETSGQWFLLFTGAFSSKDKLINLKQDLEEKYGFKGIKLEDYSGVSKFQKVDLNKAQKKYLSKVKNKNSETSFNHIPLINGYRIQNVSYINFRDDFDVLKTTSVKVIRPRYWFGIPFKSISTYLNSFTEVTYEHCLTHEMFKITILGKKHDDSRLTKFLRESVWEGRERNVTQVFLEKDESVWDFQSLNSYQKLELSRMWERENYTFFVSEIHSPSQLTKKWNQVSSSSSTYTNSPLFNNLNLMSSFSSQDIFMTDISFVKKYRKKESEVLNGVYQIKYGFFDKEKGAWEAKYYFLNDIESAKKSYNLLYSDSEVNSVYENLETSFGKAQLRYIKVLTPHTNIYQLKANELQFVINNIVGEVSNKKKALLSKEELLMIYHLYFNPLKEKVL